MVTLIAVCRLCNRFYARCATDKDNRCPKCKKGKQEGTITPLKDKKKGK